MSETDRKQSSGAAQEKGGFRNIYPPIQPFSTGFLKVDDIHTLYWEQSGNPDGVPILTLHGGPGGGASTVHRRFFDPAHYRVIIFDQRGSGRSQPLGELKENTPEHLISDIEKLRDHLNVKAWHIVGESWGSTLGLAYASRFPGRCLSLILRGIFLLEQYEIDWFTNGMRTIFPEYWDRFATYIPEDERHDLLAAYYKRLTGDDTDQQIEAAVQWAKYENACSTLLPQTERFISNDEKQQARALARLEAHFFMKHVFTPEQSLLNQTRHLKKIPGTIIQGRYDIICPIRTAHRLRKAWPEADYIIVPDGGHSALDPSIRTRLIQATDYARTIKDET